MLKFQMESLSTAQVWRGHGGAFTRRYQVEMSGMSDFDAISDTWFNIRIIVAPICQHLSQS